MSVIRPAIVSFVLLTAITGVVYPLAITGMAKVAFPVQAEGSMVTKDGAPTTDEKSAVGSSLIGQNFDQPQYFWGRPSATGPFPYNASSSGGSNLGPSNSGLTDAIKGRIDTLKKADPGNNDPVPVDLVTASGSGLDPQESVAAAQYQASRVAKTRGIDPAKVTALIESHTRGPDLGGLGERVVNVLALNLALDEASPYAAPATEPASMAATATAPTTAK